jgi:glycerol-3-phosphate dehydrogenase
VGRVSLWKWRTGNLPHLLPPASTRWFAETLVDAFHSPVLRIYASDDLPGVEVGGAVKNVLAIATGLCDGAGTWLPTPCRR